MKRYFVPVVKKEEDGSSTVNDLALIQPEALKKVKIEVDLQPHGSVKEVDLENLPVVKKEDGSSSAVNDLTLIQPEASKKVKIEVDLQPHASVKEVDLENLPIVKKEDGSSSAVNALTIIQPEASKKVKIKVDLQPRASLKEVDLDNLPSDPGLRPHIRSYPPSLVQQVRIAYLLKGPCQPRNHDFPQKIEGNTKRKFVPSWFDDYKTWLEYSIAKDAVFCLYCYLYSLGSSEKGHDAFVTGGFSSWRKKERLKSHVGDHMSSHNRCRLACQDLINQAQHVETLSRLSNQQKIDYQCKLNASIVCLRYLIVQGLAFRGHDEFVNQGDFVELLKVVASFNEEISTVLKNAHDISLDVQHDIINAAAIETTNVIISDIGTDFFSILVDEFFDVSGKEQLSVVVRYVNMEGCVIERFLGLVHVSDSTAASLEKGIDSLFSTHGLSISNLRGQGYNGASNMVVELNGLKSLILKRNPNAYHVHCFAYELQLTTVAIAQRHTSVGSFYNTISRLYNVVEVSCKPKDLLRDSQRKKILERIGTDEIKDGSGLDQVMILKRPSNTHWSSHYGTLINLMDLFTSVVDVLKYVERNVTDDSQRAEAMDLLDIISQFEFVFVLHLMREILRTTNELSQVLQKEGQNIVSTMNLVKAAKTHLQVMRDKGWEMLVTEVSKFCSTNEIVMLNMEDEYVVWGRGRGRIEKMTNLYHYQVEFFYNVIDMQVLEFNQRFDEVNTDLLLCISYFDPRDSFASFDTKKLLSLAKFYPSEFSEVSLYELETQLENFIIDVRMSKRLAEVSRIGDLAKKMVSTRKHHVFQLVYLLIKLSLTIPIVTATVERAFSAMKIVKSALRNHVGDKLLNDCLVPYIENDVFVNVTNEAIMQRFQNMKNIREML